MAARAMSATDWRLWSVWTEAQRVLVREVDRTLQAEAGISKAEFSVLRTLQQAWPDRLRVGDLAERLEWEKSRVSHLLTRMESRGLVERVEDGAPGRRTSCVVSEHGRLVIETALAVHERTVRARFFDAMSPEQAVVIHDWCEQIVAGSLAS